MAIRTTGLASGMDTESIVEELMAAQRLKQTRVEHKKTKLEWSKDEWKDLNTKIYKLYTDSVSKMRLQGSYQTKAATSSDNSVATATANSSSATGSHTLEVSQLASSQYVTGKQMTGITASTKLTDLKNALGEGIAIGTKFTVATATKSVTLAVTADTTVSSFLKTAKDAGINATYDVNQGRFFISSADSGSANQFSITTDQAGSLQKMGLTDIAMGVASSTTDGVAIVAAADAKITLDGATLTGSTNSFTAAGITFNLLETTAENEKITINIANDTKAAYDMVKSFVKDYNALLKEMNELYYANSASGYSPLTDDEKEAMTDDQIEQWETKIKDSLLRRDGKLGNLISVMKSSLSKSVKVDGKDTTLSTYGITTSADYTEKGLLHIYGDADDSTFSTSTDKLMTALTEDPDKVAEALAGIATNLYSTMTENMKTSTLNSALTFYNDKQMTKQVTTYEKEISEWEDRLKTIEDRYYKQFSAMETAMASMNSKSSALSSLLGTS